MRLEYFQPNEVKLDGPAFTVRETTVEPEHADDEGERLQLFVGDTLVWTEPEENWLYFDIWGDGGPSLEDAINSEVIGPAFARLFNG